MQPVDDWDIPLTPDLEAELGELESQCKEEAGMEVCPSCGNWNTVTITDPIVWRGGDHTRAFCNDCRCWF